MGKPVIALLYADTGGGHRATALAVERALHHLYAGAFETRIVNAIHALPYPYDQAERAYPIAIKQSRQAYRLFWNTTNNRGSTAMSRLYMQSVGGRAARAFVDHNPADLYVSCHALVNQVIPAAARRGTPVVGVVSDLRTVHALFWSRSVAHYTVPTSEARALAIRNGIAPERISVTGQPLLPDFVERVRRGRGMRAHYGLREDLTTLLVCGGGDGMGRLVDTVRALAQSELPIQIIAVCGRNAAACAAIDALPKRAPTRAFGFRDDLPELMGASDVLVTKAGPGSICEGCAAGLPIVLYDAVPGQESGNIDYVTHSGAGVWRPSPEAVCDQIRTWIRAPQLLRAAAAAALSHAQPDAALQVARVVVDTLLAHTRPAAPLGFPTQSSMRQAQS